ncbi:hypothetical protein [Halanaerobium congolense]|jgi:hypothetical protein|nr:hypothetical protein [Halanaerobium congolense]
MKATKEGKLGEKSIDQQDSGANSSYLMLKTVINGYLKKNIKNK